VTINFTLNGRAARWNVEGTECLRDLLREKGMLSVRDGCSGEGSCGMCAILLDGEQVNSCLMLAAGVDGRDVKTLEWMNREGGLHLIQRALVDSGSVQCGYCTPAVALAIWSLLERSKDPSEAEVRDALSGTLCRCTGYVQFYTAVRLAAERLKDPLYAEKIAPEFRDDLRHVGKVREKVDAAALARAEPAFVDDRVDANALIGRLVTSPHAHAFVRRVDDAKALAVPGVIEVIHAFNCPDSVYTTAGQGFPEPSPYDRRMFPRKVRYVGDRVALVVAESEAAAREGALALAVDYEVLPAALTPEQAMAPHAPLVHSGEARYASGDKIADGDGRDDPVIYQFPIGADVRGNLAASVEDGIGDLAKGFAEAEVAIEREYVANRVQCTPIEPHVAYAKREGGRLVLHASTQVPWHVRRIVARAIGLPENRIRIIKERVGGGFGAKQDIVVEDLAAYAAWKTGRPVLVRLTRAEEFYASRTRHPMKIKVKLGAKRDGKLTAIKFDIIADTGAYGEHCLTVPMNGCSKSLPLVLCDNVRFSVKSYYTNMTESGAYQGYGAPQGSFALQTALAELACELGLDPVDLLERNMVRSGSRIEILKSLGEGREGQAVTLGECGLDRMVSKGKESIAYAEGRKARRGDVARGKAGVIIQQGSGLPGLDAANAEVRLLSDGTFLALSGGADLGTGLDTVVAKAVAETLGVDPHAVAVLTGDTDTTPFDKGAYASSGTFFTGSAARLAAEDLKRKLLAAASELMGEPVAGLSIEVGGVVRGRKSSMSFASIAHKTTTGEGPGELSGVACFKTEHAAFPYGAHFVEVAVNERTGEVVVERYHALQDCGTPINPELAIGQIYGGALKAIGHSLYEEMLFDGNGVCLNPDFLDYKIPTVYEVPRDYRVELMPVDDPVGPFGAKSVSEISLNGAAPAIAVAIHDATGVWVREWPFTPERVLKALGKL
jgi:putative selenate reductase molybdopterin-binding subunit